MVNGRSLGAHFYQDSGGGSHKFRKKPLILMAMIAFIVAILALMPGITASTATYDSLDHCSSTFGTLTRHSATSIADSCFEFTDGVVMDDSGDPFPICYN